MSFFLLVVGDLSGLGRSGVNVRGAPHKAHTHRRAKQLETDAQNELFLV